MNAPEIKRHPTRRELLAYAENLVARLPISAAIAKHVALCPVCAKEASAMRASFQLTLIAPDLEPSANLASRILVAAQTQKLTGASQNRGKISLVRTFRGLAAAACLLLLASVWFWAASDRSPSAYPPSTVFAGAKQMVLVNPPDSVLRQATEIERFERAMRVGANKPQNAWEKEWKRSLQTLQTDLSEGLAALSRNPGSVRAGEVVSASLVDQAETLKKLYIQRSL